MSEAFFTTSSTTSQTVFTPSSTSSKVSLYFNKYSLVGSYTSFNFLIRKAVLTIPLVRSFRVQSLSPGAEICPLQWQSSPGSVSPYPSAQTSWYRRYSNLLRKKIVTAHYWRFRVRVTLQLKLISAHPFLPGEKKMAVVRLRKNGSGSGIENQAVTKCQRK